MECKDMQTSDELTTKQEKLIALLLTEKTIDEACKKAGVNVTTYWRWMKDENFIGQYRKMRRGILENTVAKLQSITYQAIETLERNLTCENPSVEIRCAQIILEQSLKGLEMLDIENRLEMLEHLVKHEEENDEQTKSQTR
ncbi:MAG: phBC6A51 family helix-turn-helix protein [Pyrinomonadaceae bacterium]